MIKQTVFITPVSGQLAKQFRWWGWAGFIAILSIALMGLYALPPLGKTDWPLIALLRPVASAEYGINLQMVQATYFLVMVLTVVSANLAIKSNPAFEQEYEANFSRNKYLGGFLRDISPLFIVGVGQLVVCVGYRYGNTSPSNLHLWLEGPVGFSVVLAYLAHVTAAFAMHPVWRQAYLSKAGETLLG